MHRYSKHNSYWYVIPINIPNKISFIIILNIDTKSASDYDSVVEKGTTTNVINPISIDTLYDSIRQNGYKYIGFKSMYIAIGMVSL